MDLRPYVAQLQQELATAAEAGGDDARALAARLTAPLDAATRLALLDALSTAAGEISLDLDDASVDLRLRGREPEFVVTTTAPTQAPTPTAEPADDADDAGGTARFSLRLPERLKPRLEQAAERDGVSVNAWLVRAVSNALDGAPAPAGPRSGTGQRRSGWVR